MPIQKIRQMIREAIEIERQTGNLKQALMDFSKARGVELDSDQLTSLIRFVQKYVEHSPALLDELTVMANKAGIYKEVKHIIEVAVEYFLTPLDVIPDRLGLLGLIDDAYLTHRLIQALSNAFQSKVDKPLVPSDLNKANMFIRKLIGEPQATMLDNSVTYNFETPAIQQSLVNMFEFSSRFNNEEAGRIWENAPINEFVNNRHHP